MALAWDIVASGPAGASRGVLLLPGGGASAASFGQLMAEPALADLRLVAATLPGHAGTPPPEDFSVEHYADAAAVLAAEHRCDVVFGFSMGATVALEMVAGGRYAGPVVLAGISLSTADEPAFFRAAVRISPRLGDRLVGLLMRAAAAMARRSKSIPPEHREVLVAGLRRNEPRVLGRVPRLPGRVRRAGRSSLQSRRAGMGGPRGEGRWRPDRPGARGSRRLPHRPPGDAAGSVVLPSRGEAGRARRRRRGGRPIGRLTTARARRRRCSAPGTPPAGPRAGRPTARLRPSRRGSRSRSGPGWRTDSRRPAR
jgi:hypothetical protein